MDYNLKEICKINISSKTVELNIKTLIDGIKEECYLFSSDKIILTKNEIETIAIAIIKRIPLKQIYMTYNKESKRFSIVEGEKIALAIILYTVSLYNNDNIYAKPNDLLKQINANKESLEFESLELYIDCLNKDISFDKLSDKSKKAFLNRTISCVYIETENCLDSEYKNIMNMIKSI